MTSTHSLQPGFVTPPAHHAVRSSPIDLTSDHRPAFSRLVQVELRKMRDTRAGLVLLLTIAAFTVAVPVFLLVAVAAGGIDRLVFTDFLGATEVGTTVLLPPVVILLVTSEWSQRSAMTTFSLTPNRIRILAAKLGAALIATAVAVAAIFAVAALANIISGLLGNEPLVWDYDWTTFGTFILGYGMDTLFAFAVAVLLLNSPAALVGYYLARLAFPPLLYAIGLISWFEPIVKWIDPLAIVEVQFEPSVGANWAHLAVSTLIWTVVPLVIGIRRVQTSEIK